MAISPLPSCFEWLVEFLCVTMTYYELLEGYLPTEQPMHKIESPAVSDVVDLIHRCGQKLDWRLEQHGATKTCHGWRLYVDLKQQKKWWVFINLWGSWSIQWVWESIKSHVNFPDLYVVIWSVRTQRLHSGTRRSWHMEFSSLGFSRGFTCVVHPLGPSLSVLCGLDPLLKRLNLSWAASKTSMKGFSIEVDVGPPPRKQNLHARKPRESSAKGVRQGRAAKAAAKAVR